MTFESALSFFVAIFIFSITPGPGIFAIMARALTKGARSCVMLSVGMTISDILYLIAACLGLATLANHWGELFTAIRLIGAAYLIYLGWKMWTTRPTTSDMADQEKKHIGSGFDFLQGFMISASNPKVILFYIAFLPTFLDVTALDAYDVALASGLTSVALMLGLMLVAFTAARAAKLIKSERGGIMINRIAGSIMVAAGSYLASRS